MKTRFRSLLVITLALLGFGLPLKAYAVSPPPDGGYPGGNTAEGQNALLGLTAGTYNTAVGLFSLESNTEGNFNTAIGAGTLIANTEDQNTATGAGALLSNTTGSVNTANGAFALFGNTTGNNNTAVGVDALLANTDGSVNCAFGVSALASNTTGNFNAAMGVEALVSNTDGVFNTAIGGYRPLFNNTVGQFNTAIGAFALFNNVTGNSNTALGQEAGEDLESGSGNVFIGAGANPAGPNENNHTYIKNIRLTSVNGGGTDTVTIDLTTGLLGHLSSSRRYKQDIKPMADASEALYRLRPVSFRYKKEIDRTQTLQYGLVAEEAADADPQLAIRNGDGHIEDVQYRAVNAMLLNEFLKEHGKVQELAATVAQQQKEIQALASRLKEYDSKIQKVSDQIEITKASPQLVTTNQ